MVDKARIFNCPHCSKPLQNQTVMARCPYCNAFMAFPLPEYEFYEGVVGCEHCHRKSNIRIGGYYEGSTFPRWGQAVSTTKPKWDQKGTPIHGGRLLSIEAIVPAELAWASQRRCPPSCGETLSQQ